MGVNEVRIKNITVTVSVRVSVMVRVSLVCDFLAVIIWLHYV